MVYITKEQKKKADKIRNKYKVSLSTLAGIVSYELANRLVKEKKEDLLKQLQEKYIQEKGNYKTSIKPREICGKDQYLNQLITNKNTYTSNALIIYLDGKIKNYIDDTDHYYSAIDKKLNEAYDIYWDYNCNIRNQRRMLRQNKEYWKKALEEC